MVCIRHFVTSLLSHLRCCSDAGYTLALWVNFTHVTSRRPYVYLSNGGHSESNHGVAMIYDGGNLEVRFRDRDGREWSARADDVLPGRWYHVAAAWNTVDGLSLYVDGDLAYHEPLPRLRPPGSGQGTDEFLIGKANNETRVAETHPLAVDEFNFWSDYKNASTIKQLGLSISLYVCRCLSLSHSLCLCHLSPIAQSHSGRNVY